MREGVCESVTCHIFRLIPCKQSDNFLLHYANAVSGRVSVTRDDIEYTIITTSNDVSRRNNEFICVTYCLGG